LHAASAAKRHAYFIVIIASIEAMYVGEPLIFL
jgi:hypothetical protein